MSAARSEARLPGGGLAFSEKTVYIVLGYLGLALLNAFGLSFVYGLLQDDNLGLAIVFAVITLGADVIFLVPRFSPVRWMAPGLMLVTLLVIYPIAYTVITAFTNYGDGHRLTKEQLVDLIHNERYVPEDARVYSWDIFQNEDGDYALWLVRETEDGSREVVFARVDKDIETVEDPPETTPALYGDYFLLDPVARTQALTTVQNMVFGKDEDTAAIRNRREAARPLGQRYLYNEETDTITDRREGIVYVADDSQGLFIPENNPTGAPLVPGYRVNVGLRNFRQLVEDSTLLEPFAQVFAWTVAFAFFSVITTFVVGLLMAMVLYNPIIPYRKFWRSLIFIPYAIPGVIAIVIWRGMLNQNLGIITNAIADSFIGYRIPWFANPWWAKVAVLLVNLWLGYPYMMLICSGALQAIPSEVYEAAAVDGAKGFQTFRSITLPLLLVTVGPLLIASFVFNFNNYLIIEALTEGNPPIAGTSTPVGHTDILINYTYNLAFGSGRGAEYGYASAIAIVIFMVVALITLVQFRFTRMWEEIGENV